MKHQSLLIAKLRTFPLFFSLSPSQREEYLVRNQFLHLASVTDSNHIQLISVNKITVPLVYLPSGDTFFLLNKIISPMIVNKYSDSECQVSEHIVPLLGICLLGLRDNLDNVWVPGLGESCWQNLS